MSLTGAINSAVSALSAQSNAISSVSNNLANSSTYGYKTIYTSFESLVAGSSAETAAGGVLSSTRQNTLLQGLLTSTSSATDMAIDGNGFFVVSSGVDGGEDYYTRNGQFEIDSDGYLVNNGYYLQGWPTDADGTVTGGQTASALQAIDVDDLTGSASPTTEAAIKANLPADAAVGDTFTSEMDLYDSLGNASSVDITWSKTGDNTWSASFSDPTKTASSDTAVGTVSSDPIGITFNSDGTLASTDPSPATLSITGWTTGAADSAIAIDFGTAGGTDGLTQYASDSDAPAVELDSIDQDGVAYGKLTGITIGDDGTVMASFANGQEQAIFKIPVATFTNANGLSAMSGTIYAANLGSGSPTLQEAGTGGAGDIVGSTLEASTTDTSQEFSTMMSAQQAYSAAAQVMTTANSMYETLINALR